MTQNDCKKPMDSASGLLSTQNIVLLLVWVPVIAFFVSALMLYVEDKMRPASVDALLLHDWCADNRFVKEAPWLAETATVSDRGSDKSVDWCAIRGVELTVGEAEVLIRKDKSELQVPRQVYMGQVQRTVEWQLPKWLRPS